MRIPPEFHLLDPKQPSFVIADELRLMPQEQAILGLQSLMRCALLQGEPEALLILTFAFARWKNYSVSRRVIDEFLDLFGEVEEMRMQ